jgi:mRNA interferase RelE/StbE
VSGWRIETSEAFDKSIRKLDRAIARRVIDYLEALLELEDPRQRGRGLTANRSGYWRYRVGDYRILAQLEDDLLVIVAIDVAHRSEVYSDKG